MNEGFNKTKVTDSRLKINWSAFSEKSILSKEVISFKLSRYIYVIKGHVCTLFRIFIITPRFDTSSQWDYIKFHIWVKENLCSFPRTSAQP